MSKEPNPFSPPVSSSPDTGPAKKKSGWITVLKFLISFALLGWLFYSRYEQFETFWHQEKNLWWLLAAQVTMVLAFMFSYIRWRQLAHAIRLELTIPQAIRLGLIGSFFNVIAFGVVGGDSLRAFYVAREKKDRIPEAILSVFLDRVIGLLVMLGFAGIAWRFNVYFLTGDVQLEEKQLAIASICNTAGILSICGFLGLFSFVFFPSIRSWPIFTPFERLPKIGDLVRRGMDAAALYSERKRVIGTAIFLSICTNLLFAATIWLVSNAVSTQHPSFLEHGVISPICMVANSIPLPGGVGGMEVALSTMYESYQATGGLIVALCFRICILLVSLLGWFVWLRYASEVPTENQ